MPSRAELREAFSEPHYQPKWTPEFNLLNLESLNRDEEDTRGRPNAFHVIQPNGKNVYGSNVHYPLGSKLPPLFGLSRQQDATCVEAFEIQRFPFDCQDLHMFFEAVEEFPLCKILPCPIAFGEDEACMVIQEDNFLVPEWKFYTPQVDLYVDGGFTEVFPSHFSFHLIGRHFPIHLLVFLSFWFGVSPIGFPLRRWSSPSRLPDCGKRRFSESCS